MALPRRLFRHTRPVRFKRPSSPGRQLNFHGCASVSLCAVLVDKYGIRCRKNIHALETRDGKFNEAVRWLNVVILRGETELRRGWANAWRSAATRNDTSLARTTSIRRGCD